MKLKKQSNNKSECHHPPFNSPFALKDFSLSATITLDASAAKKNNIK
jgi:hypothetical protein